MVWLIILLILLILGLSLAAVKVYGRRRWDMESRRRLRQLETGRVHIRPPPCDPATLDGLPSPVQRYLRTVLLAGQPLITAVTVVHEGTFNLGTTTDRWRPFTSTQRIVIRRPGFYWDAAIRLAPGLPVRVRDAYILGEGVLQASLLGVWAVMDAPPSPGLAHDELMRFLAESAWYPSALLPGQGVSWDAVDAQSARATLTDGTISTSLLFRFAENGLVESVYAADRGRTVDGREIPTPWEGRWSDFETRQGMRIPMTGEVAWLLPDGPKPYWRGRIRRIAFDFAR